MPVPNLCFAPYREIADQFAETLAGARRDDHLSAWSREIIVPSWALAEAITRELLVRVPEGVAGLQIHTLDVLARRIVNDRGEYPRLPTDGDRRLAMRIAIRGIDHPMMETRGIAGMIERTYRDVRDSGKKAAAEGGAPHVRVVAKAWREYERLLKLAGATDSADVLAAATRAVRSGAEVPQQFVAGFYDLTGAQRELLLALRDAGRVEGIWIPVGEGEDYRFASSFVREWKAEPALSTQHTALRIKEPKQTVVQFETRAIEIAETCRAVAELLAQGTPAHEIGVVARSIDPRDARLLNRFAAADGFTTTLREEVPLVAHRVGRGLATLLRIRDANFPRSEVLELVRDGLKTRTSLNVDRVDVETRRARIAGGTSESLSKITRRHPAIDDYIALVTELEEMTAPLATPMRGEEWSNFLRDALSRFRLSTEMDLQAAETVDEIAETFRRAGAWNVPMDVSAALYELENSTLTQHSAPSTQHSVWAGDVMTLRGRSFEHLFVIRMQDDLFPQRRIEDPLLRDADRARLGVREIGNGRDEERLLFRLLHDSAGTSLHLSYAGSDGFGKGLRPSLFLRGLQRGDITTEAQRAQRTALCSLCLCGDAPTRRPLQLLARAGTAGIFDGYLSNETVRNRALEVLQSITPTRLEDFGECPQKFLLKHLLGVIEHDDPTRELQIHHREKGTLDHRILERFYRHLRAEEIDRCDWWLPELDPEISQRLETIIDEEFDRFADNATPFNPAIREIERRATKRNLRQFVATDIADLRARGMQPQHFEYRFGPKYKERGAEHPEPFIIEAGGVAIRIDGSIDRIDVAPASAGEDRLKPVPHFRIIDYKSGKAIRHQDLSEKIDLGVRLQLALYAMAVADFFKVDSKAVSGAIKPLIIGDAKPSKFEFELSERRDGLIETLNAFISAIVEGHFPAIPNDNDFDSCKYCPVNHACRTKHDSDERYAVMQIGNARALLSGERGAVSGEATS